MNEYLIIISLSCLQHLFMNYKFFRHCTMKQIMENRETQYVGRIEHVLFVDCINLLYNVEKKKNTS